MTATQIDELKFILLACGSSFADLLRTKKVEPTANKPRLTAASMREELAFASTREELSLQPDPRPVERNQEYQYYELDHGKTCTHAHQIACGEIAVGVTDDQHAGLIGEQLAAGRKRPDHAEQQRMHAVGFCKLHHQRDGCAQHGNLTGQEEMIEERGPVHDYRRAQDSGHVGCHPGEHRLG